MINVVGFKIFGSNKIEDNLSGDCFDHYTRIEISELDNRSISECWFLETNETVPFSFSEYMMNKGFIYNELYLNQIENAINENSNIRKLDNYYFIDITSVFKKYNTEKNEDNCYEIELKISSESEIWNIDIATTEVVFIAYNPVLDEFTISSMYEANFEKTTIKSRDIKDLIQAKEAFAVYSEDDQSLNFYKRAEVPSVGGQFDGRTVTEVYTGIENTDYSTPTRAPWSKYYISKAKVIDDGIKPKNINYWFARSHSGGSSNRAIDSTEQTIDLSKLDASEIKGALGTFMNNTGVDNIILKNLNFSSDVNMSSMFERCMLTNVNFSGSNTINIINLNSMFSSCDNLISIDISNFNTAKATDMLATFAFCNRLQKIKLGEKFEWKGTEGYLPAPSSNYIPNADGKWYNSRGQAFAPEEIPNNVADTYYASKDLIPKATMYVSIPTSEKERIETPITEATKSTRVLIENNSVFDPIEFSVSLELPTGNMITKPIARKVKNAYFGVGKPKYQMTQYPYEEDNYLHAGLVYGMDYIDNERIEIRKTQPSKTPWSVGAYGETKQIEIEITSQLPTFVMSCTEGTPSEVRGTGTFTMVIDCLSSGSDVIIDWDGSDTFPEDRRPVMRIWVTPKTVAHKITKAYIGVPTQIPIYEEHETTTTKDVETLITPSNISNFFTRAGNAYTFIGDSSGKFTSTNQGTHSTSAKATWTAKKQIKKLTFSYRVSSERNYDKYSITVGDTIVADNISGNGSNQTYSGSLSSGGAIVLRYSKDGSTSSYDDCGTIWDIKVTTAETVTTTEKVQVGTETKEVARLCYQAPPQ